MDFWKKNNLIKIISNIFIIIMVVLLAVSLIITNNIFGIYLPIKNTIIIVKITALAVLFFIVWILVFRTIENYNVYIKNKNIETPILKKLNPKTKKILFLIINIIIYAFCIY